MNINKLKKKKYIYPALAVLLVVSMTGGVLIGDSQKVHAQKASLPGIEKIVMNNSSDAPFTILEVLSDKKDAKFGYLVGGEEPVDDSGRSLRDMPNKAERTYRTNQVKDIPEGLSDAVSYEPYSEGEEIEVQSNSLSKNSIKQVTTQEASGETSTEATEETTQEATAETTEEITQETTQEIETEAASEAATQESIDAEARLESVEQFVAMKEYMAPNTPEEKTPTTVEESVQATEENESTEADTQTIEETTQETTQETTEENTTQATSETATTTTEETTTEPVLFSIYSLSQITCDHVINVCGQFVEDTGNGDYKQNAAADIYEECTGEDITQAKIDGVVLYRQYRSLYKDASGTYSLHLKPLAQDTVMPRRFSDTSEYYNYQYFAAKQAADESFSNFSDGDYIFKMSAGGELTFFGKAVNDNGTMRLTQDGQTGFYSLGESETVDDFYSVHEAQGSDSGSQLYYLDVETLSDNSATNGYRMDTGFQEVGPEDYDALTESDICYIKKSDEAEYSFNQEGGEDYRFVADYAMQPRSSFQYNGGFTNKEWFKQNVFDLNSDEEYSNMVIKVVPVTVDELNTYDLTDVDMIYFSGIGTVDVTTEKAQEILAGVLDNNLPVVFNRSIYPAAETATLSNLTKLSVCLLQDNLANIPLLNEVPSLDTIDATKLSSLKKTIRKAMNNDTGELSYVNQSLFINDDTATGTSKGIADSDFSTLFSDGKVTYGFAPVIEEIQSENFYLKAAGKTEMIAESVSKATAIRYIINYGSQRHVVVKSTLNVLDLEPYDPSPYCEDGTLISGLDTRYTNNKVNKIETDSIFIDTSKYTLSKDWLITNIATQMKDHSDQLAFDMMGTKEFIGKQTDLNATYDMIYIGMDTSVMNTERNGKTKTDNTIYNDDDMDGLVYSHMGDIGPINNANRLSGNDITTDKLRELKEYVEAGYAVLLSDEFFRFDTGHVSTAQNMIINEEKLDKSSNLYKFINEVVLLKQNGTYKYFGQNVNIKKNLQIPKDKSETETYNSTLEIFAKYLNLSKLVVNYDPETDVPTAYNKNGEQQYLTQEADGTFQLRYKFSLTDDAAVSMQDSNYNCLLYIDANADGRFQADEQLDGLTIVDENDSAASPTYETVDGVERAVYHLTTDHTYRVSRQVPEGYNGFLSWKLVLAQNNRIFSDSTGERSVIRKALTGYCAIAAQSQKPTIKVLQIQSTKDNKAKTSFDFNDDQMKALYSSLNDFSIEVETISSYDFANKGAKAYEFLTNYDMVILGFDDCYYFYGSSEENGILSTLAIRKYALSGRSILFTHDLNSSDLTWEGDQNSSLWGFYANKYLRDVQGMDRYGYVEKQVDTAFNPYVGKYTSADNEYKYDSVYDSAALDGDTYDSTGVLEGMGNFTNLRNDESYTIYDNYYAETAREAAKVAKVNYLSTSKSRISKSEVTAQNQGQITQYPFLIPDTFNIANTHPQYQQLNLDTNCLDSITDDDITVWYTISGGLLANGSDYTSASTNDQYYKASANDSRNYFYIYNKGNVTYTGCGHSDSSSYEDDDLERKLFVNTMVAAYNSGTHPPLAVYKEKPFYGSADVTSIYLPYDKQLDADNDDTTDNSGDYPQKQLTVNFRVVNKNLKNNAKPVSAKYYVEVSSSSAYDVHIGSQYLKEITPLEGTFKRVAQDGTQTVAVSDKLTNFTLYTAKFDISSVLSSIKLENNASLNFYVRMGLDDLKTDKEQTNLDSNESLSQLKVVKTELMELK